MKRLTWILPIVLLASRGSPAPAQTGRPLQQRTISEALDSWITNTETHVVPVAEVMPEDRYSFAPAPTSGEFKGVRTFAQQVKHLAANNYWMAALMLGDKPTPEMSDETGPDSVRTKAEVIEYLKGSFAALHKSRGHDRSSQRGRTDEDPERVAEDSPFARRGCRRTFVRSLRPTGRVPHMNGAGDLRDTTPLDTATIKPLIVVT